MRKLNSGIAITALVLSAIGCSLLQSEAIAPGSQVQMTETLSGDQETGYTLIDGRCDAENCLFATAAERDFLIGVATVTGYYIQLKRSAFEQTKQCDSFVLIGGSSALIRSLLSLIESGNTVYTKNDLDQPVISLDLSTLTESERERLVSSTASQPASVVLLANSPTHQGASVCFSHFEILRVK